MKIRDIIFSVVLLFVLTACGENEPTEKEIAPFSFEDQNEQSYGTDELEGQIWGASFVFTNCETDCPPMMHEMASLQKELEKADLQVEFVSFTVEPEIDSPEILKQYIQQFTDNESNWHMLTGYSQETIEELAREQFQTIVQKPDRKSTRLNSSHVAISYAVFC